jgi:opacity protein-like surface antigen
MAKRVALAASILAAFALASATAALADAGGQGTVSITQHANNVTLFSFPTVNPCDPTDTGTLTAVSANEVFHVTFFTTGPEFWVTGTDEGTVTFTPDNPNGVSATGHFSSWFGESLNNFNDVQTGTDTFVLTTSNGSHIVMHETFHVTVNALGRVTVLFDKTPSSISCTG